MEAHTDGNERRQERDTCFPTNHQTSRREALVEGEVTFSESQHAFLLLPIPFSPNKGMVLEKFVVTAAEVD